MHPTLLHSQNHLMKILMSEEQKTLINNFVSQCVSLYEWIINRARISAGCNNMVQLVLVFNTRFSVHWALWTSTSDILWVYAAFLSRNARLCAWFIDTIKIDNPSDWVFFLIICVLAMSENCRDPKDHLFTWTIQSAGTMYQHYM